MTEFLRNIPKGSDCSNNCKEEEEDSNSWRVKEFIRVSFLNNSLTFILVSFVEGHIASESNYETEDACAKSNNLGNQEWYKSNC